MDLIEDDISGNTPEFSVSELSGAVKRIIEGEFGFVRVRGEVGRVSRPRSGHVYLDLKDDRAVIAGVMWKGMASRLQTQPEEGMEVVATGRLTTFPGQSKYQIVIEDLRPAGLGALMAMLEKRKALLAGEGLFAPERKKPLPFLPGVIGVITSPSGAVIRDILHRLRDRFPSKVLVWPVAVQGAQCAPEVARAIQGFNSLTPGGALPRPDLLIVARGGGSVEDLWGFNEEVVARAVAGSQIPLVSAVGHETDTTLIDFVSDMRAPTPTAAAELAVPVRLELLSAVEDSGARVTRALAQKLDAGAQRLRDLGRALPRPKTLLDVPRQRLDLVGERLPQALHRRADREKLRVSEAAGSLKPALLARALRVEQARLAERDARLVPALARLVAARRDGLVSHTARLSPRGVARDLLVAQERLAALARRLCTPVAAQIAERSAALRALDRLRETLGYRATLRRGFAVVRSGDAILTTKVAAAKGADLEIEFVDGRLKLESRPEKRAAPRKASKSTPEQGSLF